MKWLVKLGVATALKYRDAFNLSVTAPTEKEAKLAKVRRNLARFAALPPGEQEDVATLIATCQAEEAALEQLGLSVDAEAASADRLPGAEPKQLARINTILARH